MKITAIQTSPHFLNRASNLAGMEKQLKAAQGDLLVFPELCTSGYNFRSKSELNRVAESIGSGPTRRMAQFWARKKKCAIVIGLPEKSRGRIYNSAILVTPRHTYTYRKTHLFAQEKKFFTKGNSGFIVAPWKKARIGMMICFDWFFPEAMRTLAQKGADIIAHPSNLVLPYAPQGMKTRCLENRVFSITANRIGHERNLKYRGQSQILGIKGECLAQMPPGKMGQISVRINPLKARDKWFTSQNHIFKDLRKKFYLQ